MKPATKVPVTEALYHAAGKPKLGKTVPFDRGFCGRCKRETEVADAIGVLSKRFGSWDDIAPDPRSKRRHLCLPCGWAYRDKSLQYHPTIIRRGAEGFEQPSGSELRTALAGPVPPDMAVMLPVSGKKAVAPLAQWGMLATDGGAMVWERRHAQAVKKLMELKRTGISETALADPAPPGYVLDGLAAEPWNRVQQMWHDLNPLRQDKTLFPMLVKLTREKM